MGKFIGQDKDTKQVQDLLKEVNPKRKENITDKDYGEQAMCIYSYYMFRSNRTKEALYDFLIELFSIDQNNSYETGKINILKNELHNLFEKWSYVPPESYRKLEKLRVAKKAQRIKINFYSFICGQLVMLLVYVLYQLIIY